MNLSESQIACMVVFGPMIIGAFALAIIYSIIEINTHCAARRAWEPARKGRRHG